MKEDIYRSARVQAGQSVSEAFAVILLHEFARLGEWQAVARSWENPEGVHQVRIAFRRMRSACTIFRGAIPAKVTREWSARMRDLAGALGLARDMDVLIDEALNPMSGRVPLSGAEDFRNAAERYRAKAYQAVRGVLDGKSFRDFSQAFPAWCEGRRWEKAALDDRHSKSLKMPVSDFATDLLNRQTRRVLGQGEGIDPEDGAALHQLRIECKKLRYALEFFSHLYTDVDDALVHLKSLQDLLGVMHDVSVTANLLEDIVAESKGLAGREQREMLLYAGALVGWRRREYHDMRDTFAYRWHSFVATEWPWYD